MKILATSQSINKELFKDFDIEIKPFITVQILIDFAMKKDYGNTYLLTSKNAMKAISEIQLEGDFYVVGRNTAKELESKGKNVVGITDYIKDIPDLLHRNNISSITYFKGNLASGELLRKQRINVKEIDVYHTEKNPIKLEEEYDGMIFMSPSAVDSFLEKNEFSNETRIFVIGESTAERIRKKNKQQKIYIPEYPTQESLFKLMKTTLDDKK